MVFVDICGWQTSPTPYQSKHNQTGPPQYQYGQGPHIWYRVSL